MSQSKSLSLSLFGYNRHQVDQRLKEQSNKITELEALIEDQVERLSHVETELDKYLEMEQALKDGILDARIAGKKIIDDSSHEADRLIEHTNERVAQYKEEFTYESRELIDGGVNLRADLNTMKDQMQDILSTYQSILDNTNFDELFPDQSLDKWDKEVAKFEEDFLEAEPSPEEQEKIWATSSMTAEEKAELQRLIQEVVKNESKESTTKPAPAKASNLVKFEPQKINK